MARKEKPIRFHLEPPFEYVKIDVLGITYIAESEPVGFSVGAMDESQGRGTRYSIEYAEALATGILKAVRAHKRREARKAK